MLNITFGTYALNLSNNIILETKGWHEWHGALREMTIQKTIGRGDAVLNSEFGSKIVEVRGILKFDIQINMTSGLRDFYRNMIEEGQPLTVQNDAGEFVYDGCYVTNTDDMIDPMRLEGASEVPFRLLIFCPKGFARTTTQTTQTNTNITSIPYSSFVDITGDTNPEPIITVTLDDASSFSGIYFTNLTTNMQINVTGLDLEDGDVITFNIEQKKVLHNTTEVAFEGVFPDFIVGRNNYQLTGEGSSSLVLNQSSYNSEYSIYGDKIAAQSFELPDMETLTQISLLLKKVSSLEYTLYDACNGGSINVGLWNVTGTDASADGSAYRVGIIGSGDNSGDTTIVSTATNAVGWKMNYEMLDGNNSGHAPSFLGVKSADNTKVISLRTKNYQDSNQDHKHLFSLETTGFGGAAVSEAFYDATGILEIIQVGSDIEVYYAGALRLTISGQTLGAVQAYAKVLNATNNKLRFYNVYGKSDPDANTDITVEIQTDSTGEPSGTPVTNGTLTISASEIGTSFAEIIKQFSTPPSLSATTTYHVVISQAGGDINNYYLIKFQNTDVLADGNFETSIDDGGTWVQETGSDMYLKLWGGLPTSFEFTLAISYFASYFNIV